MMIALLLAAGAGCAKVTEIEWESPVSREHPLVGRIWDVFENIGGEEHLELL